jgi:ribonuclease HIII
MPSPQNPPKPPPNTLHTCPLSREQAEKLRGILISRGWEMETRPYMLFFGKNDRVTVAVYEKGPKVVVQGKGLAEFVEFILEPEVLGQAMFALESEPAGGGRAPAAGGAEAVTPHFGVDESGKGDLFGPLVIAGVYVDAALARVWQAAGIQDSKRIGSDGRIRQLARLVLDTPGVVQSVVLIGPERYNEMYAKFGNLNRLLAWGHARVIENLLEMKGDCPRALSDQFANPSLIKRALMEKGRGIQLDQRTKAESDPAVAAASILARARFIDWLAKEGEALGMPLPKGASAQVKAAGRAIVLRKGAGELKRVAKMHFKTASEILFETSCTQFLPENGQCD